MLLFLVDKRLNQVKPDVNDNKLQNFENKRETLRIIEKIEHYHQKPTLEDSNKNQDFNHMKREIDYPDRTIKQRFNSKKFGAKPVKTGNVEPYAENNCNFNDDSTAFDVARSIRSDDDDIQRLNG